MLILLWPLWTLPYWLLRRGAFGPGGALGRIGAFVLGTALNPLLTLLVFVMWLRSAVTSWQPEWPMEFPGVLPSRRINRIGRENARRNPGRTAATAAALMIGIALVTFISVLANGLRVSNSDAIERQIQSDLIVTSQDGYSEFPAAVGDAVAEVDGIETVSNVRQDIAEIDGDGANLTGLDDQVAEVYDFRWEEGSDDALTQLGADGALLPGNVADDRGLALGDTLTVRSTGNQSKDFVVRGIYEGSPFYPLLGTASVSQEAFDELYERPRNRFTLLNLASDPIRRRRRASKARSPTSRTRASRPAPNGSTRRIRRSSSSCCSSTSCSRCP